MTTGAVESGDVRLQDLVELRVERNEPIGEFGLGSWNLDQFRVEVHVTDLQAADLLLTRPREDEGSQELVRA
jgi:hypothetical protein